MRITNESPLPSLIHKNGTRPGPVGRVFGRLFPSFPGGATKGQRSKGKKQGLVICRARPEQWPEPLHGAKETR